MVSKVQINDLITNIYSFISTQAKEKKAKSLIVNITGGVDSAVSAALCVRTGINTILVHQEDSEWSAKERCLELIRTLNVQNIPISLKDILYRLAVQVSSCHVVDSKTSKRHQRALTSTLTTSALDYISKVHNGIIVGAGNKDEDMLIHCYYRRGSGAVDIQPLGDIHKSEIYEMAKHLEIPNSIIRASSSTDIWGGDETRPPEDIDDVHISSEELEWARKEVDNWLNVFNINIDPLYIEDFYQLDKPLFFLYAEEIKAQWTERQKEVMNEVISLEFSSRHKVNNDIPIFYKACREV